MPRPLVFGNGRLLVQLDNKGRIRDFIWPMDVLRNHVAGRHHHLGVYVDGRFSWTEWEEWEVSQRYVSGSMVGLTTFECSSLGLTVECKDNVVALQEEGDAFIRRVTVTNHLDRPRQVELFFSQDFRIDESEIGDTAMYRPDINAMVHFKWGKYFVCSGQSEMGGIRQKTTGLRGIEGLEGTWRDAEDGRLHDKPIEQGAVDSTFSVLVACQAHGIGSADYRIDCLQHMPAFGAIDHAELRTSSSLKLDVSELPIHLRELAERSAHILLTQISAGGAITAANDSDIMKSNRSTYSYVWPRDGALVAAVLDRISQSQLAAAYHKNFFELLTKEQPFFLQKYNTDGALGSTWHPWTFDGEPEVPMQEDETALSLWSVNHHCKAGRHVEWHPGKERITCVAHFLKDFIDPKTGLPQASYDLWEERRGVHTFTVATVIAALRSAGELLKEYGEESSPYGLAATHMQEALLEHLVDKQKGRFLRGLKSISRIRSEADYTADASLLLVGRFAGLSANHPVVKSTAEWIEKELTVHSPIGGLARYSGDYYARVSDKYPGNPWIITTMWLAQEKIRASKTKDDLQAPLKLLQWVADRAETTGVLGEQFHPETGEVLTVSPLTWSQAEFITTCLDWCDKHRALRG